MNFQEELKGVEFAMKSAVGGGGSAPTLLRLDRWLYKAAKQLGSEDAKHDLDARQSSSLLGRERERGVESNKADLEAKSVSEAAKQRGS